MNVWQELGIAPTAEVREIRRAYAQRLRHTHPEDDPDGFQRLRAAYESALAAATSEVSAGAAPAGPPLPDETLRPLPVRGTGRTVEEKHHTVDVVAEAFFAADTDARLVAESEEQRREEIVWHEETEASSRRLEESRERPFDTFESPSDVVPLEEQHERDARPELAEVNELSQHMLEALRAGHESGAIACLRQLVAHPQLVHLEYRWQYEGWLLSSLMQLTANPPAGFMQVASRFFGWTETHRALAPTHRAYLDTLLIDLDLYNQVEALKGEGRGWFYQLHRRRRPLAAWLLTGAYRPLWWTYALLHRSVYAAMREVWSEIEDYGGEHLQAGLASDTIAWWERWVGAPAEPGLLRAAQAMHHVGLVIAYFLCGITALCGVAVGRIWMQGKSLDPSLLKFLGLNFGLMLACYATLSLVAIVLLLTPAQGLRRGN
jgi:hypothetical protein